MKNVERDKVEGVHMAPRSLDNLPFCRLTKISLYKG
jgi:hypothetical protein